MKYSHKEKGYIATGVSVGALAAATLAGCFGGDENAQHKQAVPLPISVSAKKHSLSATYDGCITLPKGTAVAALELSANDQIKATVREKNKFKPGPYSEVLNAMYRRACENEASDAVTTTTVSLTDPKAHRHHSYEGAEALGSSNGVSSGVPSYGHETTPPPPTPAN